MRWVLASALLLVAGSGCELLGRPASFVGTWSIRKDGRTVGCQDVGADTVTFDFRRVTTGETRSWQFQCVAGMGSSGQDLWNDDYDVTVTLWNGFQNLARSTFRTFLAGRVNVLSPVLFDLGGGGTASFAATWSVTFGGQPSTCAAVGGDTVVYTLRRLTGGQTLTFSFACAAGSGTSAATLANDAYDVSATLMQGQTPLAGVPLGSIVLAGARTNLPNAVFALGPGGGAAFRATWTIVDAGAPATCAGVGADTVTLDFVGRANGSRDTFIFDCAQGLGHVVTSGPDLTTGAYDVTVTLWAHYDTAARESLGSATLTVALAGSVTTLPAIAFTFVGGQGRFGLTWAIVDASGPPTCAAVGADTFEWRATNTVTGAVDTFLYDCTAFAALTDPALPYGTYDCRARLLAGATVLGSVTLPNLVLAAPQVPVPTFAFAFP